MSAASSDPCGESGPGAGAGHDTINLSPLARNLDNIQGYVWVNGGTGTMAVNLNDHVMGGQTVLLRPRVGHRRDTTSSTERARAHA